ncbi:hypothetical protein CYMTET_10297 [Cymbomonas tetramitiformis]|uniref:Uncharacterized protein n=1 Tax=Cymbomonas tetramitiformis TaxID=36881 RepID=A0AAE0LEM0_9CHLO|nr:hypothetical protein CYMTET_10297 [Cymbomonas tetramitiformis]
MQLSGAQLVYVGCCAGHCADRCAGHYAGCCADHHLPQRNAEGAVAGLPGRSAVSSSNEPLQHAWSKLGAEVDVLDSRPAAVCAEVARVCEVGQRTVVQARVQPKCAGWSRAGVLSAPCAGASAGTGAKQTSDLKPLDPRVLVREEQSSCGELAGGA